MRLAPHGLLSTTCPSSTTTADEALSHQEAPVVEGPLSQVTPVVTLTNTKSNLELFRAFRRQTAQLSCWCCYGAMHPKSCGELDLPHV